MHTQVISCFKSTSYEGTSLFLCGENYLNVFNVEIDCCINSQIRRHGTTYSQVCSKFKQNKIALNRKMLSEIIINDPLTFDYLVLQSN